MTENAIFFFDLTWTVGWHLFFEFLNLIGTLPQVGRWAQKQRVQNIFGNKKGVAQRVFLRIKILFYFITFGKLFQFRNLSFLRCSGARFRLQ